MDNHPIPQDVTGFQFRLIGDMTVKQFAYLASGVIMGWILFAAFPLPGILKIPFAFCLASTGIAFAFLPIDGRPMDVMISHFVKDLITPNQYLYQRLGGHLIPVTLPKIHAKTGLTQKAQPSAQKLQAYLQTVKHPKNSLDEKEMAFLKQIQVAANPQVAIQTPEEVSVQTYQPTPQAMQPAPVQKPQPEPKVEKSDEEIADDEEKALAHQVELLEEELSQAKKHEQELASVGQLPQEVHQKVLELENQLSSVMTQKVELERQIVTLQQKLNAHRKQVFSPSTMEMPKEEPEKKVQTQHVRTVPKGMESTIGVPITPYVANLVTGIIKDSRNNVLPNILVEIKDLEGNPMRAFKTNALGQFAAATPLLNGSYTMEFEDPEGKHKFDAVAINATGAILEPLEIISMDAREELRRALFN